ncbi:hypothetical protein [Streptomyces sp. NPDC049881]|uniref:hypothetical protein n=1 Tax=Streptomyces sp. NPDC049881 TaxID=3155778 RepID=UPI003421B01F
MRPERFQQFVIDTYRAAGLEAEPWADGTRRPFGVAVTLPGGARTRHAITVQSRDGDRYADPEETVEGEAPAPADIPAPGGGRPAPAAVESYLTAVLTNAGSREIIRVYAYSDREQPATRPGFGVLFHSGARAFCLLDGDAS